MEDQPVQMQKSRRGRKRQSDEDCLSEVERMKKEKNRRAAQKCRTKKENEAKELKRRNDELEIDNKKLSEQKTRLEEKAHDYYKIIKEHIEKGCKLPENVHKLYKEDDIFFSSQEGGDELFRAVGYIDRDQTPPHTPEGCSHGNYSPSHQYNRQSVAPTALFSGTPLTNDQIARRKNASQSASPASPITPADDSRSKQENISFAVKMKQSLVKLEMQPTTINDFSHFSGQILPTVVSEMDEEPDAEEECISQAFSMINNRVEYMETDFLMPLNSTSFDGHLAKETQSLVNNEDSGQNLPSLGFKFDSQYSYTKDLQNNESVQEMNDYTYGDNGNKIQGLKTEMKKLTAPSPRHPDNQPVVGIHVSAQALLDMGPHMTESLQQQIKLFHNNSLSNSSDSVSPSRNNQKNFLTSQGTGHTQILNSVTDQQLYKLKQLQHSTSEQAFNNNLEIPKEEPNLNKTTQPSTLMNNPDFLQNVHLRWDSTTRTEPQSTQEQKKYVVRPPVTQQHQNQVQATQNVNEYMSESLRNQQPISGDQLSQTFKQLNSAAARKFVLSQANLSSSTQLPSAQAANYIIITNGTPQPVSRLQSSCTTFMHSSQSPGSTSHLQTQQDHQGTASTIAYLFNVNDKPVSGEYTQTSSSSSTSQTTGLSSDSSYAADNIDYGANVQDLPSLNLMELQLDGNLFEKKPSRLS